MTTRRFVKKGDAVAWCWHPDCQDPSRDDQARLNVEAKPTVFTSREALKQHALEKHGIDIDKDVPGGR